MLKTGKCKAQGGQNIQSFQAITGEAYPKAECNKSLGLIPCLSLPCIQEYRFDEPSEWTTCFRPHLSWGRPPLTAGSARYHKNYSSDSLSDDCNQHTRKFDAAVLSSEEQYEFEDE